MSDKKKERRLNKLLLMSLLPYLISFLIIYYPYIYFTYAFFGFPDFNSFYSSWFTQGLILSSILYLATIVAIYFLKIKKQLNIFLLISLFINLLFIAIVIFYKYTPMLDFFAYLGAQDKLCSDKTISQMGETGQDIKKFCNQVNLSELNPRDKIIYYTVTKEDTLNSLSERFNVSVNTVRWENNLTTDSLNEGQILKILPVTGVSHQVENSETIDSIAEKYNTTKQKIIDYPFNDYSDPANFTLIPGKIIIIPDGIKK